MLPNRRRMLGAIALPFVSAACAPAAPLGANKPPNLPKTRGAESDMVRDEDYWAEVGRHFTMDRSIVNLNNGGVSPAPESVQAAMNRHVGFANSAPPPYALWEIAPPLREAVRRQLASQWGVDAEEIAITRNASEGLQICQFGIDLGPGNEVLATTQDYPRMINTFRQRERREKIVLKQFDIPVPAEDTNQLVSLYEANITPKTKLVLVSHMINLTGQIMPVREIAAMARRRGIPTIVDGAHALAHFDFKLSDLDCDYYATSLHKWLFAPHGTGLLYVRKSKIRSLWPLMAAHSDKDDDIRKFEEIGTHPEANTLAIAEALAFHQAIGGARKEARLIHLRDLWCKRLLASGRVRLHTSLKAHPAKLACGIATFQVEGIDPVKLQAYLWSEHRILTVAIVHQQFQGVRVTPSVYTTPDEIDRFCSAVERVIAKGLPA
ncbi:MAG: aminotransferase class V-fold PLP-dependent enzyme [Polyangiaceae bacterium]|nr:aminotransferase class V-fold PLP-dependent enzyme [Polyangiaceae bacterium]